MSQAIGLVLLGMLAGIGLQSLAVSGGLISTAIPYSTVPLEDYKLSPRGK